MKLSGVGVWSTQLRYGDPAEAADAAAELDELGFPALWVGDIGPLGGQTVLERVDGLLTATKRAVIATGILNIWKNDPAEVAARHAELNEIHGDRFLLGLGLSHGPVIDMEEPGRYSKPIGALNAYLDALDQGPQPVPAADRVLAALGPKMLKLAGERAGGAHPYLTTPEHTRNAREILGRGPLLLPEQTVVLGDDKDQAYQIGAEWLRASMYLQLPNYVNSILRLGFTEEDITSVSKRLLDELIVSGDEEAISARVKEHLAAGADHVAVQVLTADTEEFPREQWRRLAAALL